MPKEMRVEVNGAAVAGVLDVSYSIGRGWDPKTGKVAGEFTLGTVTITREMQTDSYNFLRRAKFADERFPVTIVFRRQNPNNNMDEDYIWIDLDQAFVAGYTIHHQDWKQDGLSKYLPLEIIDLGYQKVKMKTANGEGEVKFGA